jgi:5-deoxy-glucuronate isomerase
MSSLLRRPHRPDDTGCVLDVTPRNAGWTHVGFQVYRLGDGQRVEGGAIDRETCLVVLSGVAEVAVDGRGVGLVGGRKHVFEDAAPGAVYVPAGTRFELVARSEAAQVACCSAPGRPGRAARIVAPAEMSREVRGRGTNTRFVRNILSESQPADSLLVVEVLTPAGNWSSYPPHKHDSAVAGVETALEETYYHRVSPSQGFAFQRVYTDDRSLDETLCVHDGDLVLVPRGYHPVGAAHGYDLYYLNVMAGPQRKWLFRNDPAHAWIMQGS